MVLFILFLGASAPSWAQNTTGGNKYDGPGPRLRLELSGYRDVNGGKVNGDYYISGAVELELPIVHHASLGLRLLPLLLYPNQADHPDIYGVAAGVGGRLYTGRDNTGLFVEAGAAALWNMDKFKIDNSRLGFLGDCGIGYQFQSGFHLTLKAQRISETGIADFEHGTTGVGGAFGFSF
jgi:hypothetical protein